MLDFLHSHGLVLGFTSAHVGVHHGSSDRRASSNSIEQVKPIWNAEREIKARVCITSAIGSPIEEVVDECMVPEFGKPHRLELPQCSDDSFKTIIKEYADLFRTTPGMPITTSLPLEHQCRSHHVGCLPIIGKRSNDKSKACWT